MQGLILESLLILGYPNGDLIITLSLSPDLIITLSMSQSELRWEGGVIRDIRSFLHRVKAEHNREWVSPQVSKIQKF